MLSLCCHYIVIILKSFIIFEQRTMCFHVVSVQFSSVAQSCPTLCDPMDRGPPDLPAHHQLQEFTQTRAHQVMMPSSHLILCCPFLLLPPIPPSIRVFSNESTLCMRWPEYWSFSFSISPSNEHPGLISFRVRKPANYMADPFSEPKMLPLFIYFFQGVIGW